MGVKFGHLMLQLKTLTAVSVSRWLQDFLLLVELSVWRLL